MEKEIYTIKIEDWVINNINHIKRKERVREGESAL